MKQGNLKEADIAQTLFIDYANEKNFLNVQSASFVSSDALKSPMNGNTAAFSSKEKAEQKAAQTNGVVKNWPQVLQSF